MITGQRHEDVHAQADQLRLLKLAQTNPDRRQPWSDLPAPRAVAAVLSLLVAFQRGSERTERPRRGAAPWENDAPLPVRPSG
jgi:hypothetical protein